MLILLGAILFFVSPGVLYLKEEWRFDMDMDQIADFMVSSIVDIDAQSTVKEGAILLGEKNISSLLVRENEDYVGIITKTDIIKRVVATGLDPKTTKINSVMSKPLLTRDHYLTRGNANEFMLKKQDQTSRYYQIWKNCRHFNPKRYGFLTVICL